MFGKKKPDISTIETLIGSGTTITGDLAFRGGLHLDGRIVGEVCGDAGVASKLTIGADGRVEGSVTADELVLNGTVEGDVTGRERVSLGASAKVDGNVTYNVLQMAAGARVNGRMIHHAGGQQALPAPAREPIPDPSGPDGDEIAGLR